MQIISGKYKGRKLSFPRDKSYRPTQQRVKESLFDILQNDIEGAAFLDLCCGTGGIGLEALSRGAKSVVFVDKNVKTAQNNLSGINADFQVTKDDAINYIKTTTKTFDIIFFDPPWNFNELYECSLKAIFESDILNPKGILICEHQKKFPIKSLLPMSKFHSYTYGDTSLAVIKNE